LAPLRSPRGRLLGNLLCRVGKPISIDLRGPTGVVRICA
jgi:hypothetical protein